MSNATPRAIAQAMSKTSSAPSTEQPDLLAVSDDLGLVRDLIEAAYFAAGSVPAGLGREPISRLLDLIRGKLGDAIDHLDNVREAGQ